MPKNTRLERYEFSEDEKDRMGRELALTVSRLDRLRREKKEVAKEANEQIKAAEERIFELGGKITSGYEMREISIQHALAFPKA
jgi:hypothetical protein